MRRLATLATLLLLPLLAAALPYDALKKDAESSYAEKSFSRAHDLYEQASKSGVPPAEKRWVEFRLADTSWRAEAANPSADPTNRNTARNALEALIRDAGDDHDRVWAEAHESLGDFGRAERYGYDVSQARAHYLQALDWWAGSADLDLARERYLALVWKTARPAYGDNEEAYGIPREVLVNAAAIATTPEDRAHARYLLATQLLSDARPESIERALELLDLIIRDGKATPWYDDALFSYASRIDWNGRVVVLADGQTTLKPDYNKALELLNRILTEFTRTETRYYVSAKNMAEQITSPSVTLAVGSNFLPRSEQEVILQWRNVKQVDVAITPVDLVHDPQPSTNRNWIESISLGRAPIRRWTFDTKDTGEHIPGTERMRLEPRLEPGAYIVTARANGKDARQLVLVSDVSIVVHSSQRTMQVYVADVMSGEPVGGAQVRVLQQRQSSQTYTTTDAVTDANGLAKVDVQENTGGMSLIFAAKGSARQAYHSLYSYGRPARQPLEWQIYAFTDRPAYRPDETVQWKIIARTRENEQWTTPHDATLEYEIYSPRNEKIASGKATLNAFGSFWAELPLTSSMPLGAYSILFRSASDQVGSATLFRLEEYKLPEFRVSVSTPEENGIKKRYRLGDTIEATVDASYYFGGPVANATVQVVVHQQPFYRYWFPWREYAWYFEEPNSGYYGGGQVVKQETLKTDENGRAIVRIDTPRDSTDLSYRIEARVTDASRREVSGAGIVNVTRQRYSVLAHPHHYIHRPGEQVSVDFKAVDANEQPVETTGTVNVVRRRWQEVWLDPAGREVSGAELERLRGPGSLFPLPGWRTKIAAYHDDDVMTTKVATDAEGQATFTFTPDRDGYYIIKWTSTDADPGRPTRANDVVQTETGVWVSRNATTELGYHTSGIEIILDKETARAGESAPVLIVTPASGRWVLLSTTGDDLLDTQLVHLDGTVKLVQLPLDDRHVPNFFITATSMFDRTLATDTKSVVVPPVEHFLDVGVKLDREQFEPRQEGAITVTTRDLNGKPVAAEVALSVSDESVTAIAQDFAGDPRQFFFGERRYPTLQITAGVQSQRFVKLIEGKDGKLIDERVERAMRDREKDQALSVEDGIQDVEGGVEGGVVGGVVGGGAYAYGRRADGAPPPAPAPPPVAANAVAEAITVTASLPVSRDFSKEVTLQAIDVQVRSDFRSTALWKPNVVTDANGTATVKLKFPEALTTWRATARAVTTDTRVGMGSSTARTNMPLIVRLQAPRFFVVGDRATVSAVINNNTDEEVHVTPSLEVEGLRRDPSPPAGGEGARRADEGALTIPPHAEARADWTVVAEHTGTAKLRVKGTTATRGDAMEKTFTVYEHGVDKFLARSGKLRGDEAIVKLDLPARRATQLTVQVAPSLAVAMIDALPYLIDYPYGCTEQTMSRFLPAAIVARTLSKNGLDINDRIDRRKLDDVTAKSMARLYDFQHGDGGWGWWKDGDSDEFMTAYVVWGFSIAKEAGLKVRTDAVDRAVAYLEGELPKNENQWHDEAWILHAISAWRSTATAADKRAFDDAWKNRDKLTSYSRALLALTAHRFGDAERAKVLIRNLEDGVKLDKAPDQSVLVRGSGANAAETMATAHWGEDRFWWRWYEGPVETTAFALQALVTIDPQHRLIEPVMNWLVKNRRGAQWNNTRDTAIALLGLNDYLRASGELRGDVSYELSVNGTVVATKTLSAADVLRAPSTFTIDDKLVKDANEIRIRKTRGGTLYFSAEARFVSLEEPVTAAGNEIFVRRDYFRLVAKPTLLKGVIYERVPLLDQQSMKSGERVEVVVTIETKNDYEYLMFEDLKPAGLEAVELQSGQPLYAMELRASSVLRPSQPQTVVRRERSADQTGRSAWVYQELRDRKVAMFIDHLPQGVWEIRYPLRAEVPGFFHALPVLGQAMYVPEIRANSDEVRVTVE